MKKEVKLGDIINLIFGDTAVVTEVFSVGFHYHIIDFAGDFVSGHQYINKEAVWRYVKTPEFMN